MPQFNGGCLCGKIRYSANADPIFMAVCHCKDCQRATGSAFEAILAVPEAAVSVQGTPKQFAVTADSGKQIRRSFCPDCGSTLMTVADAMPGALMLLTGTLDDTSQFKPTMQIYCDSAQPRVDLGGGIPRFAKMPGPPG